MNYVAIPGYLWQLEHNLMIDRQTEVELKLILMELCELKTEKCKL